MIIKKMMQKMAAVAALTMALPLSVLADPPATPVLFYGTVTVDGSAAAVGTVVTAYEAGGEEIASATLETAGNYAMNISESDELGVGETITFKIEDDEAGETDMVSVIDFSSVEFDLTLTTTSDAPSNPSGNSGGGGGGNSNPATPATPATPADPKTGTPATPATPASDQHGQVKGITAVNVKDGDIIQCQNSANPFAVYIVKEINGKKHIRHIVSLQIFNHYKHLKWENLVQVDSLDEFSLSGWARVNTGANGTAGPNDKVYEINGDQTRHWIDMTAEEFIAHGGSEAAIYSINQGELSLYKEGPAVKLQ
ncbi:MAG: hypothetical protein PHX30_06165 [Candidatus Pacebacteria bacterium]|nr:hypothetical protein [Candidatus Paceibacterota bacterium]